MKFIYVFGKEDCDMLRNRGYVLIQSDEKKNLYVFENKNELDFSSIQCNAIFSDTLTL